MLEVGHRALHLVAGKFFENVNAVVAKCNLAQTTVNQLPLKEMMSNSALKPVERMYPFVLRSRALIVGREMLRRRKRHLHFVLITRDISAASLKEILTEFSFYPIVQNYTTADLEKFFGIKGAKAVGFAKSGLAQSIYAEMKSQRINKPVVKPKPSGSPDASSKA